MCHIDTRQRDRCFVFVWFVPVRIIYAAGDILLLHPVLGDCSRTVPEAINATVTQERDNATLYAALINKIEQLLTAMERHSLAELIELFRRPRRMLFLSFVSGIARGFGMAVGFTIVGAIFLYTLGRIAQLNLPIIGEFVAEIARIVEIELRGP